MDRRYKNKQTQLFIRQNSEKKIKISPYSILEVYRLFPSINSSKNTFRANKSCFDLVFDDKFSYKSSLLSELKNHNLPSSITALYEKIILKVPQSRKAEFLRSETKSLQSQKSKLLKIINS